VLQTEIKHLNTEQELRETIESNPNVMICCGRMGPMCIPVYGIMHELESTYPHVAFRDMSFDVPDARFIKRLPECRSFRGLPFTVYFRNGKIVHATSSIQSKQQVVSILDRQFGDCAAG